MRRSTAYIFSGIIFLMLVLVLTGWLYFYTGSAPPLDQLRLPGLTSRVEIISDRQGNQHIYAQNQPDLFFGLGYLQASQCLYIMDLGLRIARGELAAVQGRDYLACDRMSRLLNFKALGYQAYQEMDSITTAILQAYAQGINQYIDQHPYDLPLRFKRQGYRPLHWQGRDCLTYLRCWQWLNTESWNQKILLYKLLEIYDRQKISDGLTDRLLTELPTDIAYDYQAGLFKLLTNFWRGNKQLQSLFPYSQMFSQTVFMTRDATGAVINTTYPTLAGTEADFLNVELCAPHYQATGTTLPGLPVVLTGYNARIAWTLTRNAVDDVNFSTHALICDVDSCYLAQALSPLYLRQEMLTIKGAADTTFTFYQTAQGVLIDLHTISRRDTQQVVAVQWAGSSYKGFFETMLALGQVGDREEFTSVTRRLQVPGIRLAYIDQHGQLGNVKVNWNTETANYFAYPLITSERSIDHQPAVWTTEPDYSFNPPQNRFLYGNCHFPGLDNETGSADILDSLCREELGVNKVFYRLQQREFREYAKAICVPFFKLIKADELDTFLGQDAYHLLAQWDFDFSADSRGLTLYAHFVAALLSIIYEDEMQLADPALWAQFMEVEPVALQSLLMVIQAGESSWFDNVRTPQKTEHIKSVYRRAFELSRTFLVQHYGTNTEDWRWHQIVNRSIPLISDYKKIISDSPDLLNHEKEQTLSSQAIRLLETCFRTTDSIISINLQHPRRLSVGESWPVGAVDTGRPNLRHELFSKGVYLMPQAKQAQWLLP